MNNSELLWSVLKCSEAFQNVLKFTQILIIVLKCFKLFWSDLIFSEVFWSIPGVFCSAVNWTDLKCCEVFLKVLWRILKYFEVFWIVLKCPAPNPGKLNCKNIFCCLLAASDIWGSLSYNIYYTTQLTLTVFKTLLETCPTSIGL